MPPVKILFIAVIVFAGCSDKTSRPSVITETPSLLIGPISRGLLTVEPFGSWFNPGYQQFKVDSTLISRLRVGINGVDIMIFMGTWCHDTQREVPKVYRILDALNVPEERINMVAMDRNKKTPDDLESGLNILRVPTIIFYADGVELGRIIERPVISLMEDMQTILLPDDSTTD